MNLLFVCSRNQWRSPTAEAIYRNIEGLSVSSAGTEPSARVRLTAKMIDSADIIFVMEQEHKVRIRQNFPQNMQDKIIIVLDIPDEYGYMDDELVAMLRDSIDSHLQQIR
ncbi:MAG: protein tyrosine phosphatase [Chitinophagales bacterium]|nr:protein tyrosine phosphatase [Chitinophagales bacterium]